MRTTIATSILTLALAAPAVAQQTPMPPAPQPGSVAPAAPTQMEPIEIDRIEELLGEAGVDDRAEFQGRLVRAVTPEGHPVMFVFGPENLAGDEEIDFNEDEIRGRLNQAAFEGLEFVEEESMVRGTMGDKAILAFTGEMGWRGTGGPASADVPDRERLTEQLGELGLQDREEFEGTVLRASAEGRSLFVLVGPEDFAGDTSVDMSAEDLTAFQEGFSDATIVEDVRMVRGTLGDHTVVAVSGSGVAPEDATSAIPQ